MNKKNLTIIIILVICVIGAIVVFVTGSNSTVKGELKNFAVEDTSDVDKIFLADKSSHEVLLTRDGRRWKLNGKYYAREEMVNNLFDVIRRVKVRTIVAKAAQENILKRMASGSIKVEIYKKGELYKVYYVGSGTQDNMGSFMLLENSSAPFICYLPGHHGTITNFFMPLETEWRDHMIFNYRVQEMQSVSVAYPGDPNNNFTIEIGNDNALKLRSDATSQYAPRFDTSKVKSYLLEYKSIAFEDFVTVASQKMDSVRKAHHLFTISVKERGNGIIRSVKAYRLPLPPGTTNDFGKEIPYDEDRMYGEISGTEGQVLLQYQTFDRIAVPFSFFQP